MPKLSLEKKLQNALKCNKHILHKYNDNRNFILIKATDYQTTKNPSLKHIYNDYKNLLQIEKMICNLNLILNEQEDSSENQQRTITAST